VELLIPDFQGDERAVQTVLDGTPEIVGHNIETVPRLYRTARGGGIYDVSLAVLRQITRFGNGVIPKTGLMLGLGETEEEILQVLRDVHACGVRLLTLGQYLRPSGWHLPVARYYHPEEFEQWKRVGEEIGFLHVESGPLVRSSYLADRQFASYAGAAESS